MGWRWRAHEGHSAKDTGGDGEQGDRAERDRRGPAGPSGSSLVGQEIVEVLRQGGGGGVAIRGVLLQAAQADRVQARVDSFVPLILRSSAFWASRAMGPRA